LPANRAQSCKLHDLAKNLTSVGNSSLLGFAAFAFAANFIAP
jgi:hypothetical protein